MYNHDVIGYTTGERLKVLLPLSWFYYLFIFSLILAKLFSRTRQTIVIL